MSLSTLRVHVDWEDRVAWQRRRERVLAFVLGGVIGGTTLLMFVVELLRPLLPSVAWRDFLIQALSLGIYLAAVVWFALRHRPQALRIAIVIGLVAWAACALGNIPPKVDVPMSVGHLSKSAQASSPLLFWGVAFFLIWPGLAWLYRRYPDEVRRAGLNATHLPQQLLSGLLVGLLLCGHIIFSRGFSLELREAVQLTFRGWIYHFWTLCYEVGIQAIAEELFFRGFLFAHLYRSRQWGFWKAALVTSALNLLLYLPKHEWTEAPIIMVGMLFYVFLGGMLYAALYRRFRSVWSSYVANAAFGILSTVIT